MAGRARLGLVAAGPSAAIFAAASAASLPAIPSCPGVHCSAVDFVGAAAVLYRDGEEEDTLLYHLGSAKEHTTYEAEAVGVILGLHLLAKATHLDGTALAIDNTGVIKACMRTRARPGQYLLDESTA
ncbi:hypothetical protein EXIGLDRAFT_702131 [Exidia glandulosa HHB12029]|uniref:RNase H type-1 domain-containing protein n=1 Tax=Exidia glandulosa HHB12029 TaxID=1314781 RepID=A0A165LLS1_EXIGL|nr:hypothetical protein EXIGLDRAFT_702131 [Exidia glandulosa HHB12029]